MPSTGILLAGGTGVALLALAWLTVSFSAPGRRRVVAEWLGACGLYLAMLSFFAGLTFEAQESGSTPAQLGFGLLMALFGSGLVVSLVQTLLVLRTPARQQHSATH